MKTRPARSRAEVDLLPPFGSAEVVVFGPAAQLVALAAVFAILSRLGE